MNPENCVVIGPAPVQYDLQTLVDFSDTVVAGNTHKNNSFTYATVASETRLQDMLNTPSFRDTIILAPDKLYKKYVFFEQIDNLPSLPFVKSTGKSTENLSDQSLALMLALWLEKKNIYLFGYDIEDLDERATLMLILGANHFSNIFYVRKPNPSKIHLFDAYDNMQVIDYNQFGEIKNGK